jgi:hypothetical protein
VAKIKIENSEIDFWEHNQVMHFIKHVNLEAKQIIQTVILTQQSDSGQHRVVDRLVFT